MIQLGNFKLYKSQERYINDILQSGRLTEGKYVKEFECSVEKLIGVKHAIATCNGTVALNLVAHFLNEKYGGDLTVCIPATTFPATLNAFLMAGYKVILCDIEPKTLCIDIDKLTTSQKRSIDVIVPVHLMGYAANMDKIIEEATKQDWDVVEDFAEAFGTKYSGDRLRKRVGSIGDFGCSSFYMSHSLQGGELGVITTNNDNDAEVLRSMKNHGRVGDPMEFEHGYIGSNYKTTEFCAAMAYAQMGFADRLIRKRINNAKYIKSGLKNRGLKGFTTNGFYSFLGYPIKAISYNYRRKVCTYLNRNGVETRGMFPCLANQDAYSGRFGGSYPVSEEIENKCFYIPVHQYLKKSELDIMIKLLNGVENATEI